MATTSRMGQATVIPFRSPEASDPAGLYLARLAAGSRPTMRWALRVLARELGGAPVAWARVGYAEVVGVRARLAARYAPATANLILSALRGVLREAWRLGQMSAEELQRATDVPRVRGSPAPAGRALRPEELAALLGHCLADPAPAGARDAAIVALLAGTGIRRAELAALDLADYDEATGDLVVRAGKGRKGRVVYAAAAAEYVQRWLAVRGRAPGPLVGRARGGGRLTGDGVLKILARRADQAGLETFSPHDLRRTWISSLLDLGADLASTQSLAGHADPKTTAGYDRRGERARRQAARLLRLPSVVAGVAGGTHGGEALDES